MSGTGRAHLLLEVRLAVHTAVVLAPGHARVPLDPDPHLLRILALERPNEAHCSARTAQLVSKSIAKRFTHSGSDDNLFLSNAQRCSEQAHRCPFPPART